MSEQARIYFINAGLNLDSNFHPSARMGQVYQAALLTTDPGMLNPWSRQGRTVVELVGQVPRRRLVDHALARAFDKGAIGQIVVSGPENPEIYEAIGGDAPAEEAPPADGADGGEAAAGGEQVSILPGSSEFQDMDSPDEFDENEAPADYSVNVLRVPVGTTVTWTNDDQMMHRHRRRRLLHSGLPPGRLVVHVRPAGGSVSAPPSGCGRR